MDKIISLFAELSEAQKQEVLKKLQNMCNSTAITIAEFNEWHQKEYGKNITFDIATAGLDHAPIVTVQMYTAFGMFIGNGSNQKIAKAEAVKKAWEDRR